MSKVKMGPQTWLFPMPAVLVGALVEGKPNFMTAAWAGVACSQPPLVSVAIRPSRYTLKGISAQGVFSINVPSASQREIVDFCGVYSGMKTDKSGLFTVFYGNDRRIPLVEECPIGLECRVERKVELGTHVLVIAEVLDSHVDDDCQEKGKPLVDKIDPLVFIPSAYYRIGERLGDAFEA